MTKRNKKEAMELEDMTYEELQVVRDQITEVLRKRGEERSFEDLKLITAALAAGRNLMERSLLEMDKWHKKHGGREPADCARPQHWFHNQSPEEEAETEGSPTNYTVISEDNPDHQFQVPGWMGREEALEEALTCLGHYMKDPEEELQHV